MQITVKLKKIFDIETFNGANGEFKRQLIIVEQANQDYYPDLCLEINPDRINMQNYPIGSLLVCDFNLRSREYNGKWYTTARAWQISNAEGGLGTGNQVANDFNNRNNFSGQNNFGRQNNFSGQQGYQNNYTSNSASQAESNPTNTPASQQPTDELPF